MVLWKYHLTEIYQLVLKLYIEMMENLLKEKCNTSKHSKLEKQQSELLDENHQERQQEEWLIDVNMKPRIGIA